LCGSTTGIGVEWVREPAVPMTVTGEVPAEPAQERAEVPKVDVLLTATLDGDNEQVRPVEGAIASESVTVPEKPPSEAIVIVEHASEPAIAVTEDRLVYCIGTGRRVEARDNDCYRDRSVA